MNSLPYNATMERPKRPRTAYNYFFQDERQKLLDTLPEPVVASNVNNTKAAAKKNKKKKNGKGHGKIGFCDLAKVISTKWRVVTPDQMVHYASLANADKMRYQQEMADFREHEQQQRQRQQQANMASVEEHVHDTEEDDMKTEEEEDCEPLCWVTGHLDWEALEPLQQQQQQSPPRDSLVSTEGLDRLRINMGKDSTDLFISLFK